LPDFENCQRLDQVACWSKYEAETASSMPSHVETTTPPPHPERMAQSTSTFAQRLIIAASMEGREIAIVSILLLGDPGCGKSAFLSYVRDATFSRQAPRSAQILSMRTGAFVMASLPPFPRVRQPFRSFVI